MGTPGVPLNKTKQEIIEAIFEKRGIVVHAAEMLQCYFQVLYKYINADKDIKDSLDEARKMGDQERIDRNEVLKKKAYKAAENLLDKDDVTQTIFTLKALCKWGGGIQEHSVTINKVEKPYVEDNSDSAQISLSKVSDPSMGSSQEGT